MKKIGLFQKIDALYTKATEAIIGDIPMDCDTTKTIISPSTDTSPFQTKLQTLKNFTKTHIDNVKRVGLKKSLLTMGEPEAKDVLYKEVIKREKKETKEIEKKEKAEFKAAKILEKKTKDATKKALSKKQVTNSKKATSKPSTKTSTKKKIVKPISKKTTNKKTSSEETKIKKVSVKKEILKKTKKLVSKRDAKIALYIKDIKKHYGEVDEDFVAIIVKNLGPSIYKKNAELVSCSDPKELDTVRKNFLMKKLGINASKGVLDAAIQDVCKELKASRHKYRATFYYSLAKKFKKESALS